ncbi:MAG: EboA domain-containing protein [Planctomycetota bacterium]
MADSPLALLQELLEPQLTAEQHAWLARERGADVAVRDRAFTLAPRRVGREALPIGPAERRQAEALRPGWRLHGLTRDDAARLILLLDLPSDHQTSLFGDLCVGADLRESLVLYRGLPLYAADPAVLISQARKGLRSNVVGTFVAIAHHSPFAHEQFDTGTWNQMVLKALFIGVALWPIQALDARANPELKRMLIDYARERRAAGRSVPAELWRGVGPAATAADIDDLLLALRSDATDEREAAALALAACPVDGAGAELEREAPELSAAIAAGQLAYRREEEVIDGCA